MKAIVFDLDGTLFAKPHIALHLVMGDLRHITLIKRERTCRKTLMGSYYGADDDANRHLFDLMAEQSKHSAAEIADWYRQRYLPTMVGVVRRHYRAASWVEETLLRCRQKGVKTAVLSDYLMVAEKLQAIGLSADRFDLVADTPSMGGFKPCPQVLLRIAEQLGTRPEETLVVGDRRDTDGEGARMAGMQFMWIDNEHNSYSPDDFLDR